jgi:hypothetical protein
MTRRGSAAIGRILPDRSRRKTEDRVLLCNGVGDYQHGRYAALRFDR